MRASLPLPFDLGGLVAGARADPEARLIECHRPAHAPVVAPAAMAALRSLGLIGLPHRRASTPWRSWPLAGALSLLSLAWASHAQAQATSWLYVGGGAGVIEREDRESHGSLQLDAGLGTSAKNPIVVGGLFRVQGYFGAGADLAIVSRLVTRGFARGGFGAGIDAGAYQRWWGADSTGFVGNLVLGAPWGLTLIGGATTGTGDQRSYFASLGIDLARLTVHRHSGLSWFANPMRSPSE